MLLLSSPRSWESSPEVCLPEGGPIESPSATLRTHGTSGTERRVCGIWTACGQYADGVGEIREETTVPEGRRESVMGEGTQVPCGPREVMEGKSDS